MCKDMAKVLGGWMLASWLLVTPVTAQTPLNAYERDIINAAAIYTVIAFSEQNRQARRASLPVSDAAYRKLDKLLPPRFQACMEGGFAASFLSETDARALRQLMQSVISSKVEEPENARRLIPGFTRTNQWCSSRIPLWTAAILG